jgi:F0F1-type ATP synthase membrane subunit b/b'
MSRTQMTVSPTLIVALLLAFFGFVASVSGVILHLRVEKAFEAVQIDIQKIYTRIEEGRAENTQQHSSVQISVEQLKTKVAELNAETYRQIMIETRKEFIDRDLADSKHAQNVHRLDNLTTGLHELGTDLRQHRASLEQRLVLIEERLPV